MHAERFHRRNSFPVHRRVGEQRMIGQPEIWAARLEQTTSFFFVLAAFPFACLANKRRKVVISPDYNSQLTMDEQLRR